MTLRTSILVLAFSLSLAAGSSPAFAKWVPVQSLASDSPLAFVDGDTGKSSTPQLGFTTTSFQEGTYQAFSHAVTLSGGNLYELRLVGARLIDYDSVTGRFDVYRNGVRVCTGCVGKAYGLSGAIGDYFKIYIGSPAGYAERWHFSAYITQRFDY